MSKSINYSLSIIMMVVGLFSSACAPFRQVLFEGDDLVPPQLMAVEASSSNRVEVYFDEDIRDLAESVQLSGELTLSTVASRANVLMVTIEEELQIGALYQLAATVEDPHGNSLDFVVDFYGHNPQPAKLRINEFTPQGSGKHPDLVELYAYEAGNLGE